MYIPINSDLFGITDRLKSVDEGYFVLYNKASSRFEVHNSKNKGDTLCVVVPYESLDARTVSHVKRTRAERVEQLMKELTN